MMVINLKDTEKCPHKGEYHTWLEWWKNHPGKGTRGTRCSNNSTTEHSRDIVGGHVRTDPDYGLCYIVPLCKRCNDSNNTAAFDVDECDLEPIFPTRCRDMGIGNCDHPVTPKNA